MDETTSWLADGVAKIAELTKAANNVVPTIADLKHEKPGTYALVMPGPGGADIGQRVQVKIAGPAWHRERLETPQQLALFIKGLDKRGVKPTDGVILVNQAQAAFHYSFDDRRDVAVCLLKISEPWAWLSAKSRELNQRELLRVLRITFAGCLPTGSAIISIFRSLKFTSNGQVEANLQRGNEALGRKLTNEVHGINDLPEEVVLSVPVFENYGVRVSVRVAIEVNTETQRFELIAFPNELEVGLQTTLEAIRNDVAFDSEVPAYLGTDASRSAI